MHALCVYSTFGHHPHPKATLAPYSVSVASPPIVQLARGEKLDAHSLTQPAYLICWKPKLSHRYTNIGIQHSLTTVSGCVVNINALQRMCVWVLLLTNVRCRVSTVWPTTLFPLISRISSPTCNVPGVHRKQTNRLHWMSGALLSKMIALKFKQLSMSDQAHTICILTSSVRA